MTIAHAAFTVAKADFDAVIAFYLAALAPLGYKETARYPLADGAFVVGMGDLWITGVPEKPTGTVHLAFNADDRATVDAFHKAALEAGAKDNGAPGIRAHYTPHYYAAFVHDPVGNNIEVVINKPPVEQ